MAAHPRALAPDGICTYCVHDARLRCGSRRGTSVRVGCSSKEKPLRQYRSMYRSTGLSNLAKEKRIEVRPSIHPSPCHAMPGHAMLRCQHLLWRAANARASPAGQSQKISRLLRTKTPYYGVLAEQSEQG